MSIESNLHGDLINSEDSGEEESSKNDNLSGDLIEESDSDETGESSAEDPKLHGTLLEDSAEADPESIDKENITEFVFSNRDFSDKVYIVEKVRGRGGREPVVNIREYNEEGGQTGKKITKSLRKFLKSVKSDDPDKVWRLEGRR